jgi:hypothetical protein
MPEKAANCGGNDIGPPAETKRHISALMSAAIEEGVLPRDPATDTEGFADGV